MSKRVYDGWRYPAVKAAPPNERYLKMIASPQVTGYDKATVVFSHIPPGSTTGLHSHPSDEIMYFMGRGEVTVAGETSKIETDSVAVVPKGMEHECRNTSATETLKLFCVFIPPLPGTGLMGELARTTQEYVQKQLG